MQKRKLPCELCGKEVPIRSTVRTGPNQGKKCCSACKQKNDRKKDEGKREFFEKAIEEVRKRPICENCGCKIDANFMPHSNVAHILAKSRYKSVANEPLNYVILCAGKNDSEHLNCHYTFDNSIRNRKDMPIFQIAKERYKQFAHKVKEQGVEREIFES